MPNIQMKHLHGTYKYENQQINLFSSQIFLIKKLNQNVTSKLVSHIGLIHLSCSPYLSQGSCRIFIFVFLCLPGPHKQATTFSSRQWFNQMI